VIGAGYSLIAAGADGIDRLIVIPPSGETYECGHAPPRDHFKRRVAGQLYFTLAVASYPKMVNIAQTKTGIGEEYRCNCPRFFPRLPSGS